ncbi:hypothetical protein EB796_002185 [Bugula neritina]|uniref:Uncharacterized protein n=1 Tax=Bugula neritina TaxID=10212 RepID=A0A7J7KMU2_BUGNE|nr:hypothetical protein EB796_002185 [Bugula neritina]
MRTLHTTPYRITGETANYMMLEKEVQLPPDIHHPVAQPEYTEGEYVVNLQERMQVAGQILKDRKKKFLGQKKM